MVRLWFIRIRLFLACVLLAVFASACRGDDKGTAFFDPDEAVAYHAQVIEALKLICPAGAVAGNGAGCHGCPKQTAFNDNDDDQDVTWSLRRVFTGHFTSTTGENLIMSGIGCESHSANFGGSFIFAIDGPAIKLLRYDEALITEQCHKFEVPGAPDMLVCTDDWGAQVTLWSYVYQVAFDEDGDGDVHRIFETIDLSRQHCGIDFFTDKPTFIQESHLIGLKMEKSPTGLPVLFVTANFGRRFPTAEERKACERGAPIQLALPTYRLKFVLHGNTLRPSEPTKTSLKAFPKPEPPEGSYATKH